MTVFIYTRVSTSLQADDGNSLETQVSQLKSYAITKGMTVGDEAVFVEKGVSGSVPLRDRPEGQLLWSRLNKGDSLLLAKLDRGFRSSKDAITTLHDLKEKGVSVHCLDIGGEVTGNGIGGIFFTILSAFAEFERSRIASRISEVKQHRKSEGFYVGGVRGFGFNVVDGRAVPNEEERSIINKMKVLRSGGHTIRQIMNWVNGEHQTDMSYSTVRSVLLRNSA
jgi:putative DNA-invertase from lambdoid prophage Rac